MTLRQFAKAECANFVQGSLCVARDAACRLPGDPCRYFEESVLPIAAGGYNSDPPRPSVIRAYSDLVLKARGASAAHALVKRYGVGEVRRCGCGEPRRPRARYCESCARARRKASNRNAQRKRRSPVSS